MLSELEKKAKVTGVKQSRKAVGEGRAEKVFIARDADPMVTEPLIRLCREKAVPVESSHSMSELGRACGIGVGAAVAALVR